MRIEDQVCTLEQAKRLISLGWHRPSVFVYFNAANIHSGIVWSDNYIKQIWRVTGQAYEDQYVNITPAYTVAELGEMLPASFTMDEGVKFDLNSWKDGSGWNITYWWDEDTRRLTDMRIKEKTSHNEAEARAALLIHLIETNQITI